MKVILLGDVHHGIRSASPIFEQMQMHFYKSQLFPYMEENGITTIFQHGDFFDNRNALRVSTINMTVEFMMLLEKYNVHMYMPLGNHDVAYKNTNTLNSPELIFGKTNNITVITEPKRLVFDDVGCDFIPWINAQNEEECMNFMRESTSKYCFGHFDVLGGVFQQGGMPSHEGLNPKVFSNYHTVYSGHFHTKSIIQNVVYLGTPFEFTWADWNDTKGFYVLDLETSHIEFIENPTRMFYKVLIQEKKLRVVPEKNGTFKDKYIKIEIDQDDTKLLEKLVTKLNEDLPADIQTVIKQPEFRLSANTENMEDMSVQKLLIEYVNNLEIDDRLRNDLNTLLMTLYDEANQE